MKKLIGYLVVCFLLITITFSCNKDKIGDFDPVDGNPFTGDCTDTVFYSTIVQPIIMNNCTVAGCHNNIQVAGGFNFESHESVSANANLILNVIQHNSGFGAMPLGASQLNSSLIQDIECWINQGKMNN
jgi:hypothetical protein